MKNIYKNIIILSLGILAIFVMSLFPIKTNAQELRGYVLTDGSHGSEQPGTPRPVVYKEPVYYPVPTPVVTPVYVETQPQPTTTVYSSSKNPNPKVAKVTSRSAAKPAPATADNNLAANAIGASTFLPSGLIQWILFAILVLLVVLLVRKAHGGDKKFANSPLKHD